MSLGGLAACERLHEYVDELQFGVVVEHVGQPVGPEPDAAGRRVVVGIRDEVHQGRKDRGAGWRGPGQVRALGAAVEDQAETLSKTLAHVVDGWPMGRGPGWAGGPVPGGAVARRRR